MEPPRDPPDAPAHPHPGGPARQLHALYAALPRGLRELIRGVLPDAWRARLREQVAPHLVPHAAGGASASPARFAPVPQERGVCLTGYLRAAFGLGESLRTHARACAAAGVPCEIVDLPVAHKAAHAEAQFEAQVVVAPSRAVQVGIYTADTLLQMQAAGQGADPRAYRIGVWFWELARFPEAWWPAFEHVDELWAPSPFIAAALSAATAKPVLYVPHAVEFTLARRYERADFELPVDRFVVLFTCDFSSYIERKNPLAAIAAFRAAFPAGDEDALLLIKTFSGALPAYRAQLEQLRAAAAGDARILVRDEVLARDAAYGLTSVCDAYLSLHRAEGLGLGMAEAMLLGKPVVATAWSGNLAFMNADNSCLVGYQLVPVGEREYVHGAGQQWAQADVGQAAHHLRRLHAQPDYRRELGARAARYMREHHSHAVMGRHIRERLAVIAARRALAARG
jgi:glycosyltransferase involved in cell wall biosynthesis